jgi:hypothetical protein
VYRVRNPHPEFGYAGASISFRGFMVFAVCGLVAGTVSVAIFNRESYRDPKDAMALAAEALSEPKPAQPATRSEKRLTSGPTAQKAEEEGANAVVRMRPRKAVNERPLIAAVAIGHLDAPAVLSPSPPSAIAATLSPVIPSEQPKATPAPTEVSVAEATPADAATAAEPAPPSMPTVTSKKPQPRVHHASRQRYHDSNRSSYGRRRYTVSRTNLRPLFASVW